MKYGTVIVVDTIHDRLVIQSLELLAFAECLGGGQTGGVLLVVPGRDIGMAARKTAEQYGVDVLALECDHLQAPNPEGLWRCLQEVFRRYEPQWVCLQHSAKNTQAASALAVATGSSCITAVESVSRNECGLLFTRSLFNGKLKMSIRPQKACTVMTILPGAYPLCLNSERTAEKGKLMSIKMVLDLPECRTTAVEERDKDQVKLSDADVIVAAGRGIGAPENLGIIREVARLFRNSAVGASRPVCDLRWLPYAHQVGVTGKTVAPRLYIACGISGSQQHIAGMKGAQCVVAVNRDPQAAIFAVADYIVIEDLTAFLRVLIQRYEERWGAKAY